MSMHLKTSYEVSASTYSGTTSTPFQGAVQGSGAAPVIWLMIIVMLVRCLCAICLVSENCTPISGVVFQLVALICVDDTDLNVLNLNQKSTLEVIE